MFYVFKKNQILLFASLILILAAALAVASFSADEDTALCRRFLKSLGYSPAAEPSEIASVTVPEGFGAYYDSYNELNKKAGFDLTPFRGCTVKKIRISLSDEEALYANLLIYNHKICGGDICDPSLSGYMLPLTPKKRPLEEKNAS